MKTPFLGQPHHPSLFSSTCRPWPALTFFKKILSSPLLLFICLTLTVSLSFGMEHTPADASQNVKKSQASSTKKISTKKKRTGKKTASAKKRKAQAKQKPVVIGNNYKGAVLYNADTQEILFQRRDTTPVPPASLTKIMSMFVALDNIKSQKISLSSLASISPKAATTGGSSMGIQADELVPLSELLKGMAICSGNDASVAMAEFIGGSEEAFVELMNEKARQLGMKNTVFKNAHGLHVPGQQTTAFDMLILARNYLETYPENLSLYHSTTQYTYKGKTTRNANSLLGKYEGVNGLKTGYVAASGYNLITTAKHDGTRFINVLLGAPTSKIREQEVTFLLGQHLPGFAKEVDTKQVVAHQ